MTFKAGWSNFFFWLPPNKVLRRRKYEVKDNFKTVPDAAEALILVNLKKLQLITQAQH